MEIKLVKKSEINKYINFIKKVYKENHYYRDIMSLTIKKILIGKAQICQSSIIKPVMVIENKRIVAVCTYAIVDRMNDVLQIAYFEALENKEEAIEKIISYGKILAKDNNINRILVGLNFHVNYGLGLLADRFNEVASFGSSYNPSYYIDYFSKYSNEEVDLVSYLTKMKDFSFNIDKIILSRITNKYRVRKVNFRDMKSEAKIYTYLNNKAFKNHRFYYERRLDEDLELFNEFKYILKEENLLFLEYKEKPIGFMLWYPDYNELINTGESLGIKTLMKIKMFSKRINKFKIVEIGVLPEFQKKGAILSLFNYCKELVKDRYELCEAGWILEKNIDSKSLAYRWSDNEYKHYKAFLIHV